MESLKALRTSKIDLWYLHGPDRSTPYEDTLREVNNLHEEGFFKRFGISNYMAWEVAQICEICRRHGWIQPTVYQGVYNAIHRTVEQELFPCLRYYGISFYEYNPLAGGYLTDRYQRETERDAIEKGSRFDPRTLQGQLYRTRYWNPSMFDALETLRTAVAEYNMTEAECALRWVVHHSMLRVDKHDAIIIGASSFKQLQENLLNLEKGPLPDRIVEAFNQGWEKTRATTWMYWR
jgi:aflatoxin B1 aldehyde reductase